MIDGITHVVALGSEALANNLINGHKTDYSKSNLSDSAKGVRNGFHGDSYSFCLKFIEFIKKCDNYNVNYFL